MLPKTLRPNPPLPRPPPRPPPAAAGGATALPRPCWPRASPGEAAACPDPGVGLNPSITGGAQSGHGAVSHTPDKSGFPSGVRGAGAFRLTLPSADLGTFG